MLSKPLTEKEAINVLNDMYPEFSVHGKFQFSNCRKDDYALYFSFGEFYKSWKTLFLRRFRRTELLDIYLACGSSVEDCVLVANKNHASNVDEMKRKLAFHIANEDVRQKLRFKARTS